MLISILMAVYQGENYLCAQIDSILQQTYQNFLLYILDDGSQDTSWEILNQYQQKYPEKIFIERNEKNSGSARFSFWQLIQKHCDDSYIMLCDQDDIWLPYKIQVTLDEMIQQENYFGKEKPLLVHTDLTVVDEELQVIADSYQKYMNSDPYRNTFRNELVQNTITGCTVMYNNALGKLIQHDIPYFVMHDWWLALLASSFGKICYVSRSTILYRQHGKNSIGAYSAASLTGWIKKLHYWHSDIYWALRNGYHQAESFFYCYQSLLDKENLRLAYTYGNLTYCNKLMRIFKVFQYGFYKYGVVRKIAQILFL